MSAVIRQLVLRRRLAGVEARLNAERALQLIAAAKGQDGETPDHEWQGTKLRFTRPDGTWGKWVDLRGEKGKAGARGEPGASIVSRGGGSGFDPAGLPLLPDAAQPTDDLIIERNGQVYRIPLSALQIAPAEAQDITVEGEQVTVSGLSITVSA